MSNMTLSTDEVNYLVYRYMQESGFSHSAFSFAHESHIDRTGIDPNTVPPGSLITYIQKGMQFMEMEANVDGETGQVAADYSMISPRDLLTKNIDELRQMVHTKKTRHAERRERDKPRDVERLKDKQQQQQGAEGREKERAERGERGGGKEKAQAGEKEREKEREAAAEEAAPMEEDAEQEPDVVTLQGHQSEVFICAWSPTQPLLASGSGDSTARIWNLEAEADSAEAVVLYHTNNRATDKSKDVTTLDWNQDGSLLATGSYDGLARIWSKDGELQQLLQKHRGPIFSLKWNKKGDLLLSGSVDKTAIIWDAKSGEVRQQFEFHQAPTLDVDWKNNNSFATCSTDHMIYVCKLGETRPVKHFEGHEDEVNAIKWDPTGRLLASGSDDKTAKVWSVQQEHAVHDFREHTKEIYTIKWSPTGPGTANPNLPLLLASASFDTTVKLWDVDVGRCLHTLSKHTEPVYSVAFSPDGRYVATGSFDKCLYVWSVADGTLLRSFKGHGGIFEVCWNAAGDRVAACFSNRSVCVVDFRL